MDKARGYLATTSDTMLPRKRDADELHLMLNYGAFRLLLTPPAPHFKPWAFLILSCSACLACRASTSTMLPLRPWYVLSGRALRASSALSSSRKVNQKATMPTKEMQAIEVYSQVNSGSLESGTKAWPMALEKALVNQYRPVTKERMFLGALVNAYSSDVMFAKISDNAMITYAGVWIQTDRSGGPSSAMQSPSVAWLPHGDFT